MNTKINRHNSTTYNAKELNGFSQISLLTKLSLMICMGFAAQIVQGACPNVTDFRNSNEIKRVNTNFDLFEKTIYFCKQLGFSEQDLTYDPTAEELLNGGSQAIAQQNNSIQSFPISSTTIDMTGINPSPLSLNLSSNLPIQGGQYSRGSIFNFYTRISSVVSSGDCSDYYGRNQYDEMKKYLSDNANIFRATSAAGTVMGSGDLNRTNNSIAKIENVKFTNSSGGEINANVYFYHTNDVNGQWFTRGTNRYCWLGVRTEVIIDDTDSNLTSSGEYDLSIGVLTQ